jgi:hypothetical protein
VKQIGLLGSRIDLGIEEVKEVKEEEWKRSLRKARRGHTRDFAYVRTCPTLDPAFVVHRQER